MSKGIIIYYSLTGNVDYIAKKLNNDLNFDLVEIQTAFDLKKTGFLKIFLGVFQVIFKIHPQILYKNINISEYDHIIIGTPVWASTFAPAFNRFFKEISIKNKNVSFFVCCSEGVGNALSNLKNSLPNNTFGESAVFFNPASNKEDREQLYIDFITKLKNISLES